MTNSPTLEPPDEPSRPLPGSFEEYVINTPQGAIEVKPADRLFRRPGNRQWLYYLYHTPVVCNLPMSFTFYQAGSKIGYESGPVSDVFTMVKARPL